MPLFIDYRDHSTDGNGNPVHAGGNYIQSPGMQRYQARRLAEERNAIERHKTQQATKPAESIPAILRNASREIGALAATQLKITWGKLSLEFSRIRSR